MDDNSLDFIFDKRFTLSPRELALPVDQRLSWRLPLLLLSISYQRAQKSSFERLAIMAFALSYKGAMQQLIEVFDDGRPLIDVPVRYEPGLPFLINFAVRSGYISQTTQGLFQLTNAGKYVATAAESDNGFASEVAFLKQYGKRLTEVRLRGIVNAGVSPEVVDDAP